MFIVKIQMIWTFPKVANLGVWKQIKNVSLNFGLLAMYIFVMVFIIHLGHLWYNMMIFTFLVAKTEKNERGK